ncbi:hypothetical protein BBP40_003431 [Aspergillus hancockii]|nr:hypothetical protein BBP40_003431 [Aspergillus hancockii]
MAKDSSTSHANPSRRTLLVTYPRTASNLLIKMLSLKDQGTLVSNDKGGYFFWNAFMKGRTTMSTFTPIEQWTTEQIEEMQQSIQQDFDNLENISQSASSQGKVFFGKEHVQWFTDPTATSNYLFNQDSKVTSPVNISIPDSYNVEKTFTPNNVTILPDEYLATWRLTFLIRHPALAFPSFYRAIRQLESEDFAQPDEVQPLMELNTTLKFIRHLYDWCCEHGIQLPSNGDTGPPFPLVLDAEDVIHNPKVVMRYSELIGLDPSRVRFEWEAGMKNANLSWDGTCQNGPEAIMKATLNTSSHILKNKTPTMVDIAHERKVWDLDFGESSGQQMEQWVRDAMPDYNYLRARRLRA